MMRINSYVDVIKYLRPPRVLHRTTEQTRAMMPKVRKKEVKDATIGRFEGHELVNTRMQIVTGVAFVSHTSILGRRVITLQYYTPKPIPEVGVQKFTHPSH